MHKLKPKELRDRLFKDSRPNIRPLEIIDETGKLKDMGILWAAYKAGSFKGFQKDMEKDIFTQEILNLVGSYNVGWLIEDKNNSFKDNYGAIGLILALSNDWEVEPYFLSFNWASLRNEIRGYVSYFQMMRYDKNVGIVNLKVVDEVYTRFLKKLQKYGVINYTGVIPKGDINGDRHIFYVRGKMRIQRSAETSSQPQNEN